MVPDYFRSDLHLYRIGQILPKLSLTILDPLTAS